MNRIFAVFGLVTMFSFSINAQKAWYQGGWIGELEVQGTKLEIIFNIKQNENNELNGFLSIPKQSVNDFPADELNATDTSFTLIFKAFSVEYEAKRVSDQKAEGFWKQGGKNYPLDLSYTDEVPQINRPQEPKEPITYAIEEITINNEAAEGVTLGATLTVPKGEGPFPAVVLVSGSGPQNRNSEILAHKPFWIIADYLTNRGIVVLRYDDRGIGESTGDFQSATTNDFASDAEAAVLFLENSELPISKVGIIGHSEGGLVAPIVGVNRTSIDFLVMLAGPAVAGDEILMAQSKLLMEANGTAEQEMANGLKMSRKIYDLIKATPMEDPLNYDSLKAYTRVYYDGASEETKKAFGTYERFYFSQSSAMSRPWYRNFITYDPGPTLEKVTQPLLALYCSLDLQVPALTNIKALRERTAKAPTNDVKIENLEGLNHLFQTASTGAPDEYGQIEETFSPKALEIIDNWIKGLK